MLSWRWVIYLFAMALIWPLYISLPTVALESSSQTLTVSAQILPVKTIYIDQNNKIRKIYSNTTSDAPLHVLLESTSVDVPFTPTISQQYQKIKNDNDLNQIGLVYDSSKALPQPEKQVVKHSLFFPVSHIFFRP